MRRKVWGVFVLLVFTGVPAFAQISCGFVIDLSAPQIDSLYPAPGETVSTPTLEFVAYAHDDGAGIWLNHTESRAQWDTATGCMDCPCDAPVATYITWAVNDFSPANFVDTTFGAIRSTATFNPGDSVRVCVHIIDSIQNYGCSCCPNDTDTCWTFYIFACDSFQLANYCPDPCGIVTSCTTQAVTFLIDTISAINGPDTNIIGVQVYVNGTPQGSGTIADQFWAEYHGNPDDGIYPDTIVINPPGGVWNHGDSVTVIVGTDSCPVVLYDTCQFRVDLVPPELTTFSPAEGETVTSAVVTISGSLTDDFVGVAPGSTQISITVYDSTGTPVLDTTYTGYAENFAITRTFNSGDSVVVCVHTADNVDIQPECTCPPNTADSCWWFIVLISEPYAWTVIPVDSNGDGQVVSACYDPGDSSCGNQQIVIRAYDSHGMTDTGIVLYVNGVRYDETSPAVSASVLGGDTLEIIFDPSAIGLCWTDNEWVHFELDSAINTLGFNLVSPLIDSFIVDLTPPVFSGIVPPDSSVFHSDSVFISVTATDSLCGYAVITRVHASGTYGGAPIDTDLAVATDIDSFGYSFTGLRNGDSITVCAYAADTCADYCGPNTDSTCWTFYIVIGTVGASVVSPVDENGDGAVISTCDNQGFIWSLDYDDEIGIVWDDVWVSINGTPYNWSDAHLDTINGHTLFFNPDPDIVWDDGDTIIFCIDSLVDSSGATLESPVCGWVLIDLTPPFLVTSIPAEGETIYTSDITVQAAFYDSVCTDTLTSVDSVWAEQWNDGTLLNTFTPTSFPFDLTGLGDGDSISVCAIVSDHCMDYCDPNVDTICWYFNVSMGEPWGEFIAPPDTNLDGTRITTCADGGFILYVHDSHGMDTTYFHFTVDTNRTGAMDYHYGDPGVSVGYVGDSTTMAIYFNPGWTLSSGSWVYVVLDSAINLLPVPDTIVSPVIDFFLIDTEPPTFTYTGPTGSISDVSAAISVSASDDICGSAVVYDSLVITSTISGIDWHITTGDWDTTITGLVSGDSVVICAYAHDVCSDTCGPNYGDSCWSFMVSTGVNVSLVEPVDLNGDGDTISACADQRIIWTITSIADIDSASIIATVCGTEYHWGDPELSASGDSIIWTPP
ncbi:MAG TPA: hypothetical protein ENG11_04015, partial [candidate division Zixibacteria bacterium]|nr:hypothetical protein [candidate division Zixibacteria bacterium]